MTTLPIVSIAALALAVSPGLAQVGPIPERCPTTVGLLATDFRWDKINSRLARVEIQQCDPTTFQTIQLVAWESGKSKPSLVIDTGDFGVVQAVARENVFVVETGGATRDRVMVLVYRNGKPHLVLWRITKGTAEVRTSAFYLDLRLTGLFNGTPEGRSEDYRYKLDLEQLERPKPDPGLPPPLPRAP